MGVKFVAVRCSCNRERPSRVLPIFSPSLPAPRPARPPAHPPALGHIQHTATAAVAKNEASRRLPP